MELEKVLLVEDDEGFIEDAISVIGDKILIGKTFKENFISNAIKY